MWVEVKTVASGSGSCDLSWRRGGGFDGGGEARRVRLACGAELRLVMNLASTQPFLSLLRSILSTRHWLHGERTTMINALHENWVHATAR